MQAAEESGQFTYVPMSPVQDDDIDRPGVTTDTAAVSSISDDAAGRVSPTLAPETEHVSQKMVRTSVCLKFILTSYYD